MTRTRIMLPRLSTCRYCTTASCIAPGTPVEELELMKNRKYLEEGKKERQSVSDTKSGDSTRTVFKLRCFSKVNSLRETWNACRPDARMFDVDCDLGTMPNTARRCKGPLGAIFHSAIKPHTTNDKSAAPVHVFLLSALRCTMTEPWLDASCG